jgi:hypothetical protein
MLDVSVNSIAYGIISDAEAIIKSCEGSRRLFYHRDSVVFCGNRVRVAYLGAIPSMAPLHTILIPYSLRTLFSADGNFFSHDIRDILCHCMRLLSLVFEHGSTFDRSVHPVSGTCHWDLFLFPDQFILWVPPLIFVCHPVWFIFLVSSFGNYNSLLCPTNPRWHIQ